MNRKLIKQVFSLMLALTLVLALSSCAVSPQELLDMLTENSEGESSGQTSPEEGGEALPEGDTVPDGSTDQQPLQTSGGQNTKPGPVRPGKGEGTPPGGNNTPGGSTGGNLPLASGSAEGAQSLAGLRELYDLPDVMFGATYLGYVEEPVAAGSSQWLWEVNETMAQQDPFLTEIDANHIIGNRGAGAALRQPRRRGLRDRHPDLCHRQQREHLPVGAVPGRDELSYALCRGKRELPLL